MENENLLVEDESWQAKTEPYVSYLNDLDNDSGWYVFDEINQNVHGPYLTEDEAKIKLEEMKIK